MVDREARNRMAVLLRHLAIGRITTGQFDAALEMLPFSGEDRVFEAIFEETFSIKTAPRRELARWILFLQSDGEYVWPGMDALPNPLDIMVGAIVTVILAHVLNNPAVAWWLTVVGYVILKVISDRLGPESHQSGDKDAWPFLHQADLAEARRHPKLLNGKGIATETMP